MSKEIVAGRSALKRAFKEYFARIIDDGKDTRSFLTFKKQREAPVPPPWIFLYHGDAFLGKTTAIDYCLSIAESTASDFKRSVTSVGLDWEDWEFSRGSLPTNRIELMDALAEVFLSRKGQIAASFSTYKKNSETYRKNRAHVDAVLKNHQLQLALNRLPGNNAEEEATIPEAPPLNTLLTPQEYELHEKGENNLAGLLASAIAGAAEEDPLLLSIDSFDYIAPDLEAWLRDEILARLAEHQGRIILLIAGRPGTLRNFRNAFSDEEIFSVNFEDITLTRKTISLVASKKRVKLSDEDTAVIERVTAGIPLLVNDILFHLSQGISLSSLIEDPDLINDVRSAELLSNDILGRFLSQCGDTTVRERVFAYAMHSQYNAKALAETWNVAFADVKHTLADLERQVSFLTANGMHHHLRRQLRTSLIEEAANGAKSALKPFFTTFSGNSKRISHELLQQLHTAVPSAEKRCRDQRYLNAIEQHICGQMWSSPTDALLALPGYYIELLHFNPGCARKLLNKTAEFRSLFSAVNEKTFKQLISGIHMAEKNNIFNRAAVRKIEEELIEYLESLSDTMNDFHRALFYHLKATIEFRKGNNKTTMELLDRSFSLLGNSAPEKSILYEDYVLLGSSFSLAGEHRNAIDTFSNAVLIHADGFVPWYSMGVSRIELKEYEGATNALTEAVKIDPLHTDAWFHLGLSQVHEHRFHDSLAALTKATELSPERTDIWLVLAKAYQELSQHDEAVKAFRKVVLAESDNVEAWVLLGNSCSALDASDDAIEAYTKSLKLKPKQVEALRALGSEYLKLARFDDAITSFKKATAISKKDSVLWCLIAEAHIGAQQYDEAVTAGEKAIAIDKTDARAWSALGDANTALENTDAAIDAFTKATETDSDNATIWLKLGTIYNETNDHEAAIAAFKKAVAFNPEFKEVWYTIGLAYENQEKYADAIAAYEKGIKAAPENHDCWYHKGEMHRMLEQFEDAFDSYSHVVELVPDSIEGWFNRGVSALTIESAKEAVDSFAKVVELDPENAEGWFQLGCSYQKMEEHQEAIRSFTEAANYNDSRTDIWMQLGTSCELLGIYEEAIQAYERCAELDSKNADYPTKAAACHYAMQHYAQAHEMYKRAVDLDPYNNETLFQLALTCHAQEQYEEAIEHYTRLVNIDPERADAQFNLALAYHAIGDYTHTVETYLDYIDKWPDNGSAWFNLGLAYHAAEDIDNAIVTYKGATKITPDNADLWYHLGIALHAKEQFGDAIQAYRKVLQVNSDYLDAWFNLGLAYYMWQNFIDAADAYQNVVKRDPQHSTAWGNLAIAYYAVDDYEKGVDAAQHAFEISPDEPWIIGNMIVGMLFSGDSLQAQEYADRLYPMDAAGDTRTPLIEQIRRIAGKRPDTGGVDAVITHLENGPTEVAEPSEEDDDEVPDDTTFTLEEATTE